MTKVLLLISLLLISHVYSNETGTPRGAHSQPDTAMGIYLPAQHELYDGLFKITGHNIYQAGTLNDPSPWDHMDDNANHLRQVGGEIIFDVIFNFPFSIIIIYIL